MTRALTRIALVVAAALASLPLAAHAAPGRAIQVQLHDLRSGSIVEGTVSFRVEASSAAGIEVLELWVNDHKVGSVEPENVRQRVELPYSWVTSMVPDSAELAPNGEYTLTARAVANGGADETLTAKVIVDNPAATPTGLGVAATRDGVRLTWEPNPEPDLLGYQIERSSGGQYAVVTQTIDTTIVDPVEEGTHSYRVIAVRSSAARSSGRPSLPSEPASISLANAGGGGGSPVPGAGANLAQRNRAFATTEFPAPAGLPGAAALPGSRVKGPKLGTYEKRLPYEIPKGGIPLSASEQDDAGWDFNLIPADGLRWIAAGFLLLAIAALLRLLAKRLEPAAGPPPLNF